MKITNKNNHHKQNEGRDNVTRALGKMLRNFPDHYDHIDYYYEFMCSNTYKEIHNNRKNFEPTDMDVENWRLKFIDETGYEMKLASDTVGKENINYDSYGFDFGYERYVFATITDAWLHYKNIQPERFVYILNKDDFYGIAASFGYHGTHIENFIEKMEKELGKSNML